MAEFQLDSAHAIYTEQQIQSIIKQKITKQTSKQRTYQRQENMYQNSKRLQNQTNNPKSKTFKADKQIKIHTQRESNLSETVD